MSPFHWGRKLKLSATAGTEQHKYQLGSPLFGSQFRGQPVLLPGARAANSLRYYDGGYVHGSLNDQPIATGLHFAVVVQLAAVGAKFRRHWPLPPQ
jgi:hypothetical protein